MNKQTRLEEFERQVQREWGGISDLPETSECIKSLVIAAFSRGYNEGDEDGYRRGFADGVVAGQNHLTQAQEMINEVFAGRA